MLIHLTHSYPGIKKSSGSRCPRTLGVFIRGQGGGELYVYIPFNILRPMVNHPDFKKGKQKEIPSLWSLNSTLSRKDHLFILFPGTAPAPLHHCVEDPSSGRWPCHLFNLISEPEPDKAIYWVDSYRHDCSGSATLLCWGAYQCLVTLPLPPWNVELVAAFCQTINFIELESIYTQLSGGVAWKRPGCKKDMFIKILRRVY